MIKRHYTEPQEFIMEDVSRYDKAWENYILDGIRNRPNENLGSEFQRALDIFSISLVGHLDKDYILRLLQNLNGIGIANFEFSLKAGENFTVSLAKESFEVRGAYRTAYMDTDTWLNAYYCAVISRDMEGIDTLCQVPERVHQEAELSPDDFDLAFVKAIKGLYDSDSDIGQLLIEAMEASEPNKIDGSRREYASKILYPQLPLYRCILSSDAEEFNQKLKEAVLDHKSFWSSTERHYDNEGWIALPLIAAAASAFDNKEIELTVETDYIPSWLARGDF